MQKPTTIQKTREDNQETAGLWNPSLVKSFLHAKMWEFEKAPWPDTAGEPGTGRLA